VRLFGLAFFLYFLMALMFGVDRLTNPSFGVLYILVWVGLVPISLLFGPVWRTLNPLRTLHLLACKALRHQPSAGLFELSPRVGRTDGLLVVRRPLENLDGLKPRPAPAWSCWSPRCSAPRRTTGSRPPRPPRPSHPLDVDRSSRRRHSEPQEASSHQGLDDRLAARRHPGHRQRHPELGTDPSAALAWLFALVCVAIAIAFGVAMALDDRRKKTIDGKAPPPKDAMDIWADLHTNAPSDAAGVTRGLRSPGEAGHLITRRAAVGMATEAATKADNQMTASSFKTLGH
jgi:hypothetical protein